MQAWSRTDKHPNNSFFQFVAALHILIDHPSTQAVPINNPPPPTRLTLLSTQFKAPYTSPECKIRHVNVICNVEFGAGVLGTPVSGRHSHKGHRGKRQEYLSLLTYCEFQPSFCSQSCGVKYSLEQLKSFLARHPLGLSACFL
jgi:hypothetical protein